MLPASLLPVLLQLTGLPKSIFDIATSTNPGDVLSFGIGLILSTIVGGLLLAIILYVAGREWHEGIQPAYAFFVVLIINIAARLGIIERLFSPFGYLGMNIGLLLLWIVLAKLFFRQMEVKHAAIVGIVGYIALIYIAPLIQSFIKL